MSNWINFSILWMLTGSPVAAAVILLLAYAIADWYAFGFLRGVAHAVADFHRGRRLASRSCTIRTTARRAPIWATSSFRSAATVARSRSSSRSPTRTRTI